MSNRDGNRTRSESIPAIERATTRSWEDWLAFFAQHGAAKLTHTEIARHARTYIPDSTQNPEWWAQGVAIAYEQQMGLRVPGQSSTGEFRVSASRTVALDRDAVIEAWAAHAGTRTDHRGHTVNNIRRSRTAKRTFWRATLEDAGRVEVAASAKGDDRSLVTIAHNGVPAADAIETWRAHWKDLLAEL